MSTIRRAAAVAALSAAGLALAPPSADATEHLRRAQICKIMLERVEALAADAWAIADLRAAAATWRALECAALYGLAADPRQTAAPDRPDGVRWILR